MRELISLLISDYCIGHATSNTIRIHLMCVISKEHKTLESFSKLSIFLRRQKFMIMHFISYNVTRFQTLGVYSGAEICTKYGSNLQILVALRVM